MQEVKKKKKEEYIEVRKGLGRQQERTITISMGFVSQTAMTRLRRK
jgi:hypothetical protein